jgi:hypothetical protein
VRTVHIVIDADVHPVYIALNGSGANQMIMTKKETIATYDFSEDAMGLGNFISEHWGDLPDDEITVCVFDDQSNCADSARLERETLTDGSTVVNLIIKFDRS